jgi:hypothetical protein
MLDGYIIEELRRREAERQQRERQQPQLDLPVRRDEGERERRSDGEEPSEAGGSVVTIDL